MYLRFNELNMEMTSDLRAIANSHDFIIYGGLKIRVANICLHITKIWHSANECHIVSLNKMNYDA